MPLSLFAPARLAMPPSLLYAGDGEFRENRLEWLQPTHLWLAIYYQHPNVVTINARTFPVPADSIVLFAPGVRATHASIGEGTLHMFIAFNLPAESGKRYAVPVLYEEAQPVFKGFRHAVDVVSSDILPAAAFVWSYLLENSRDTATLRQHEALYSAEEYILRHLGSNLRVPDIAEFAGVSARQLLRMFRDEHRLTVQEFVRHKRTQEACRLLSSTNRPIKVIAEQIGVSDLAQFNKLIRSETGKAPRVFRELSQQTSKM